MDVASLTAETILSDETLSALMEMEDDIERQRMALDLADRARDLTVKTKFDALYKEYDRKRKEYLREEQQEQRAIARLERADVVRNNQTNFSGDYPQMDCGGWLADDLGVYAMESRGEVLACYHPILPVEILTNLQTGEEKIKLAFCKNGRWQTRVVGKEVVASRSKIVELAKLGIAVTSESAPHLVRFLAEVEHKNLDLIPARASTTKFGWVDNDFVPFDTGIEFDGDLAFRNIVADIHPHGSREKWFAFALEVRKSGRLEPRLLMAASLASVLTKWCDALSFFVDLYGGSGSGKSLCLMFAASAWGNPSLKGNYVGSIDATQTGMEIRADMLNDLPFFIDETTAFRDKFNGDFDKMIYFLSNSKGKVRSNTALGINRSTSWNCVFLSTGEQPITNDESHGGAINRVIGVEPAPGEIFPDGPRVASLLNSNYGFLGAEFVEIVKELGREQIQKMKEAVFGLIKTEGKLAKQAISLSVILTADYIVTNHIFKDNQYISVADVADLIRDEADIDPNTRCYDYLVGEVARNYSKFCTPGYGKTEFECWGQSDGSKVFIIRSVLGDICKRAGYNATMFLKWARANNLLSCESDGFTEVRKINGTAVRGAVLVMPSLPNSENDTY